MSFPGKVCAHFCKLCTKSNPLAHWEVEGGIWNEFSFVSRVLHTIRSNREQTGSKNSRLLPNTFSGAFATLFFEMLHTISMLLFFFVGDMILAIPVYIYGLRRKKN